MDLSILQSSPLLLALAVGVLGLVVGSFLNVVIHRLPLMMQAEWRADCAELEGREPPVEPRLNLLTPRSRCPACGHRIRWYENIPLFSWLALRGRCSACGTAIGLRYPLVEVGTGLLFAAIAWRLGPQPVALLWCGAAAVLVALTLIDWDTTVLPDSRSPAARIHRCTTDLPASRTSRRQPTRG